MQETRVSVTFKQTIRSLIQVPFNRIFSCTLRFPTFQFFFHAIFLAVPNLLLMSPEMFHTSDSGLPLLIQENPCLFRSYRLRNNSSVSEFPSALCNANRHYSTIPRIYCAPDMQRWCWWVVLNTRRKKCDDIITLRKLWVITGLTVTSH